MLPRKVDKDGTVLFVVDQKHPLAKTPARLLIYHVHDELATRTWFPVTNDAILRLSPAR